MLSAPVFAAEAYPDGCAGLPDGCAGLPDGCAGLPDGCAGLPDGCAGLQNGALDNQNRPNCKQIGQKHLTFWFFSQISTPAPPRQPALATLGARLAGAYYPRKFATFHIAFGIAPPPSTCGFRDWATGAASYTDYASVGVLRQMQSAWRLPVGGGGLPESLPTRIRSLQAPGRHLSPLSRLGACQVRSK
jgi:hypothetical protein